VKSIHGPDPLACEAVTGISSAEDLGELPVVEQRENEQGQR